MLFTILICCAGLGQLGSFAAAIPDRSLGSIFRSLNLTLPLAFNLTNSNPSLSSGNKVGIVPTPDPYAKYIDDDHIWIVYHNYEASLGPNNENVLAILGKVLAEGMAHQGDAPMGRQSLRYTEDELPVPIEMYFRATSTITWRQWLRMSVQIIQNLPRNEANENRECLFFVTDESRQRPLGFGSVSLLSRNPLNNKTTASAAVPSRAVA